MKTLASPELAAKEWVDLKSQKVKIETRCEELKKILESYLVDQPEKTALLCGWRFVLSDVEREFFKLAEAKKKLKSILKPFITVSCFSQIRMSWQGGEEKQAG